MLAHETRQVLEAAREAWARGRRVALATVVRVFGSAYRREGAKMLAHEDGSTTCMISGGCLEPEVAEVARGVLADGSPRLVRYDLDEDVMWGLGLGCGGAVEVYIEPLEEGSLQARWLELQAEGVSAVLATAIEGAAGRLLLREDGPPEGDLAPPELAVAVREVAAALLNGPSPRPRLQALDGAQVFFDVSVPPPELVVFGAGHDAIPLVAQAQALGLRATVVDARPAYATPERFPGARIVLAHPQDFPERVRLTRHSYVVIMNHHLQRDQACLAYVLDSPAPYIGVLGPRSRFEKLLDGVVRAGRQVGSQDLERVHSPVGLDIGAEAPEEVAVSILAEILAVQRGFAGGPLRERQGRIHQPQRA
ncbi:MAG TPA: XdhC/CoxI family protein [Dehalococcoidia bacterium]|nr:XdhC/CoxI family protein [Dehalococcoidia bacterium]